jgi:hypothetical protein
VHLSVRKNGASSSDIEVEPIWSYIGYRLDPRNCLFIVTSTLDREEATMKERKERIEFRMLYFLILFFLLSGCAPSHVYTEGVLAKDYRNLSADELERYAVNIQDEITTVEKGGPVPAGETRESYLADLRSTRYGVRRQIEDRKHILLEEQKYRSDQQRTFPLP